MSEAVLTQLVNTDISIDESMKIRLLDYYQVTKLVGKQIKAFIDKGDFTEKSLSNIANISQMKNYNP